MSRYEMGEKGEGGGGGAVSETLDLFIVERVSSYSLSVRHGVEVGGKEEKRRRGVAEPAPPPPSGTRLSMHHDMSPGRDGRKKEKRGRVRRHAVGQGAGMDIFLLAHPLSSMRHQKGGKRGKRRVRSMRVPRFMGGGPTLFTFYQR